MAMHEALALEVITPVFVLQSDMCKQVVKAEDDTDEVCRSTPAAKDSTSSRASSSGGSSQSAVSQQRLSKELSDAVERLRDMLPADALNMQRRHSFGLLDLLSSQSLSESETAAAAQVLAAKAQLPEEPASSSGGSSTDAPHATH